MKKLICLFLALSLLAAAAFALAEEEAQAPKYTVRGNSEVPNIAFGQPMVLAVETFNMFWGSNFSFSQENRTIETVTLSDGREITVMTLPSVPGDEYRIPMNATFYLENGNVSAAFQEIIVPEGTDPSIMAKSFDQSLGWDPVKLELDKAGMAVELLGEAAHLEEGQNAWYYSYVNESISIDAVLTVNICGNSIFFAEFPLAASEEKNTNQAAGAKKPEDMEGYRDLTAEEQNMVNSYAEFLEQQNAGLIRLYIDFLLQKHQ